MTQLPTDDRLDRDLRRYLDWQAGQRGDAPSAAEVTSAIGERLERRSSVWHTTRLAWVIVLFGLLVALAIASALVGSHPTLPIVEVVPSPSSGPSQVPTTSPSVSANGWIAYSTSNQGAGSTDVLTGSDLYLVKAGVDPRLIAGRQGGTTRNACPAFSPDGTKLAYGVIGPQGRAIVVLGVAVDGTTSDIGRFAVPGPGLAPCVRWSSDGIRVGFFEGGRVVVRGLDGSSPANVAGDPQPEDFVPSLKPAGAILSMQGDRIAWRNAVDCQVSVARPDGSNASIIPVTICAYSVSAWSPDGRQILLMQDVGGGFTIFSIAVDSPFAMTAVVPYVQVNGERSWPGSNDVSWQSVAQPALAQSPAPVAHLASNGEVAFDVEALPGTRHGASAIDVVKEGVTEHQAIGSAGIRNVCPSFSPDGTRLAYSEAATTAAATTNDPQATLNGAVVIVGINGAGLPSGPAIRLQVPTANDGDLCPRWAPSGQSVAFLTTARAQSALWIGRLDGTVTRVSWAATNFASEFDWSPDGTSVIAASGVQLSGIWVIPIDGSPAHFLEVGTSGPSSSSQPSVSDESLFADPKWSPDGTKIAVAVRGRDGSGAVHSSVEIIPADGSGSSIQLAADGLDATTLAWSPDGQRIAFVRSIGAPGDDDIVTAAANLGSGTEGSDSERVVTSDAEGIQALVWSPDGTQLLYVHVANSTPSGTLELVAATGGSAPIRLTKQPRDFEDMGPSSISWQALLP